MDRFQQETIELALDKLLNKRRHFSICSVENLAALIGVNCQSHPDYKTLEALHCVNYSDMSAEMKAELPNKIMNCLTAKFETGLMAKALAAVANGEIKNLPPIEDVEAPAPAPLRLFRSGKGGAA